MKKLAVTGGLACGKSLVCNHFKQLGAHVVSADEVVHQLLTPNTSVGKKVIHLLGPEIVIQDKIDPKAIASRVFSDPKCLKSLEQIIHPAVRKKVEEEFEKVKQNKQAKLFVAEIPLLFEVNGEDNYDLTIAVIADEKKCRERAKQKRGYSDREFTERMARQLSIEEKKKRADIIINNNGTLDELQDAVEKIYLKITK